MMRTGALLSLLAFELRRRGAGGRLPVALVLAGATSPALGWGVDAGHLRLAEAAELYGYLYVVALALVFRFDVAHDADRGFADLMAPNLVSPGRFIGSRLLAGLLGVLQFALPAALLTGMAPGLDMRFAAWCGALGVIVALLAAPAILLAELWLRTRLPVLAVALGGLVLLMAAAGLGGPESMGDLTGIRWVAFGSFASLEPLAWRALAVGALGLGALAPVAARHWASG